MNRRGLSNRWFLTLAALIVLSTLVIYVFISPLGRPLVTVALVRQGKLEAHFLAQGLVRAQEALVRSPASGRLTRLLVKADEPVTPGQTLGQLENSRAADRLRDAEAHYWTAQSDLNAGRDDLRLTRARLQQNLRQALDEEARAHQHLKLTLKGVAPASRRRAQARVEEMRAERDRTHEERLRLDGFWKQGVVSSSEVEIARSREDQAQARWQQARQDLALLDREQAARVQAARDRLARAREAVELNRVNEGESRVLEDRLEGTRRVLAVRSQAVDESRADLLRHNLTSPLTGRVWRLLVREGEILETGTPVLKLLDDQHTWVEAHLAEQEAELVSQGQPVQVRTSGGSAHPGKVRRVEPGLEDPEELPGTGRYLRIEVDLPGNPLRPGSRVEVEGTSELVSQATLVPRSALIQNDRGSWLATVDRAGKVHLAQVKVTRSTPEGVALADGPAPGTFVVIVDPASLSEGQLVRTQP